MVDNIQLANYRGCMLLIRQTIEYAAWFDSVRDRQARARQEDIRAALRMVKELG
ncbi:MAG: hypothetical protein KGJ64_06415 [Betaproteobacteria bacterium]|nr:hypothetical protein [Betaproteobacteria bacterium]